MSGYPGGLSPRQQATLDQFRNAVADVKRPSDTDAFLLRWLRARDFDVAKAERMYRHDLKWRKENGIDDMLQSYEASEIVKENYPGGVLYPCKDGRPLWMVPAGVDFQAFIASLTPEVVQRHCTYLMEYTEFLKRSASKEGGKEIQSQYMVIDLEKFSLRNLYCWQAVKTLTNVLQTMENHYPECLEKCIVINAPNFFPVLWKMVRPFLTQRTTDKIEVYGKDGWKENVLNIIDAAQLPAYWGGDMVGPDGDPRCKHKVNFGGRFEEGVTRSASSVFDEMGAQQRTIARRERWELPVDVDRAGLRLSWRFQVATGDVAFGLRMRSGERLLPLRRLDACNYIPQEGSWDCDTPGTYVLEFDNSYSWLTDKTIAYVVCVQTPEEGS
ncbi:SEC14-like protein 2 isoform X1 [Dermacentor andersoni]|uniref:SEC14-like protein 2 isoform X1 n=2 Tax=Dermacentor andersoni TaxID=34620 RepID=UPI002155BE59|nr:SEC14-like protein 2 isoform X1 [Dermacentor andersoni]